MSRFRKLIKAVEPHPGEHFKDKAIAIVLAFLLWFAINSGDASLEIFQPVPVNLTNLPTDLAIAADWDETLSIRVSGPNLDIGRLTAGRLSPVIDLSNATAGENVFELLAEDIAAPAGIQIQRIEPAQIRILLEERRELLVPVSPVTSGEPAAGYEVTGKTTDPEVTWVSGPQSLLEALEYVSTATVDVGGRQESFSQSVALLPGNRLIELSQERSVQLRIEIREQAINAPFDGVQVVVINTDYRVEVNPAQLDVILRGPPSVLAQITVDNLELVIDATGLAPNTTSEDYKLEPQVRVTPSELGEQIELLTTSPQRVIDVHVYDQPRRR